MKLQIDFYLKGILNTVLGHSMLETSLLFRIYINKQGAEYVQRVSLSGGFAHPCFRQVTNFNGHQVMRHMPYNTTYFGKKRAVHVYASLKRARVSEQVHWN